MSKKLSSAYVVGSYILVSDRFGDIYRIKNDLSGDIEFFFSHYTTITTSIMMSNLSLSGNKDGKIVILDANEPFKVQYICHEHSSFITCLIPYDSNKFLSCSSDGKLVVWDFIKFTELQILDLNKYTSEKFGPGIYVPFTILTEFGDSSIAILFAHVNMILFINIENIEVYKWLQLPFIVQNASKLSNLKISDVLYSESELYNLDGYFFVDMNGNLWNNVGNTWQKIDVETNSNGELVDFWKQNEKLKGRGKYE